MILFSSRKSLKLDEEKAM